MHQRQVIAGALTATLLVGAWPGLAAGQDDDTALEETVARLDRTIDRFRERIIALEDTNKEQNQRLKALEDAVFVPGAPQQGRSGVGEDRLPVVTHRDHGPAMPLGHGPDGLG